MKHLKIPLIIFFSLVLVSLSLVPRAQADEFDMKTKLTFSAPVEIPGAVLPAGTYVFKLLDPIAQQNVVQVLSGDEQKIYATVLAVPDYRLQPTDKTVISFEDRAPRAPQAIRAWFYPGNNYGEEFVYPKSEVKELSEQPAPAPPQQMAAITKPAALPEAQAPKDEPATANQPSSQAAQSQAAQPPEGNTPQQPETSTQAATAKELPKTASYLPLLGLTGALSLVGALTLRRLDKRTD